MTPSSLADGDRLVELADAYAARWGVEGDRTSQASFVILDVSWYAFAPLVASLLLDDSFPGLRDASVWLDPSTREGSLALADAASVRRGIDELRAEIEAFMTPVVDAIVARRWLGRRAAWLGVGDRVVGAFEHLGPAAGSAARARALAEALVHAPGSPLDSPRHRFVELEVAGRTHAVGMRASCCRFYRVPGTDKCLTCPLLDDEEREPRLRAWLSELTAS